RIRVLSNEAEELATALGPSARSGDAVFQKALHKVELVRSYLERIEPLSKAPLPSQMPSTQEEEIEQDSGGGMLNRLGRLFRGDDE
ncbi:MAG: hypothetical protein VX938_05990, partial [Myxococcota bacterium]|nr:hypothetical protein [Myxococcota bacterium]